jgi:hypothetical protein
MSNTTKSLVNATNNAATPPATNASAGLQQGSETRTSILPSAIPDGLGMFGSPYKPADAMLTPPQIGVNVGSSMGDVVNAVKGVGFYVDQIGFGAPSTGLTNGMPLRPLGVNYFIKTGVTCSNGADMWNYMQGITEGNALGPKIQSVMAQMGLPPLKGLAPGMIEDAEHALDSKPLINAMFGSGYPQCKQVTLPVGDSYGRIADDVTGEPWISLPRTARRSGDGYVQTMWVQDTDAAGNPINLSRDQWVAAPKTFRADGTRIQEGFASMIMQPATAITVGVLCMIAFVVLRRK